MLLVSFSTMIPEQVSSDSLVMYYPFHGNANNERGTGLNHSTVVGAALCNDRNGMSVKPATSPTGTLS